MICVCQYVLSAEESPSMITHITDLFCFVFSTIYLPFLLFITFNYLYMGICIVIIQVLWILHEAPILPDCSYPGGLIAKTGCTVVINLNKTNIFPRTLADLLHHRGMALQCRWVRRGWAAEAELIIPGFNHRRAMAAAADAKC